MLYHTGMNADLFLETLSTISSVIKIHPEYGEVCSTDIQIPNLQTLSPNFDMDQPAHVNLIGENELDTLLTLTATHYNSIDMAMLIAPTDYNNKCFYYSGDFIPLTDGFFKTKTSYYLYNRIRIAHTMLTTQGIMTLLVTEPFLLTAQQLCNEIFGESNHITTHIVVHNKSGSCRSGILQQHQYVLVYAKSKQSALSRLSYKVSETAQFCIEKRALSSTFSTSEGLEKVRKYKDEISTFDLISNIRPQERRENDNNYYPIYYIPGVIGEDGYDWQPRLYLEHTGHPEEQILYPVNERGEHKIWNTIPSTFLRNYKNNSYCVKSQNGKPKLYTKIRDSQSENQRPLEPVKTILDEGMSNLSTSKKIGKLMGDKEQYFGYNPNLAYYLISAYSKEGDKIVSVNDRCLSVYIALLENSMVRTLLTPVIPSLTPLNKYLSALLDEYPHQFLNFTYEQVSNRSMLEFVEDTKLKQEGIISLMYGGLAQIYQSEYFTIYETKNYDVIVLMKMRYNLEVYLNLKETLKGLVTKEYARVYIHFVDDSPYCQGQDILPDAFFVNNLQNYKNIYNTLWKKLITYSTLEY